MTIGLAAIIIVPNLGDAKFRIPLTSIRVPVLIGGTRFPATRDPRLPNRMTLATLVAALLAAEATVRTLIALPTLAPFSRRQVQRLLATRGGRLQKCQVPPIPVASTLLPAGRAPWRSCCWRGQQVQAVVIRR